MARFSGCADALAALASGLDEASCHDFSRIRQVASCRAWQDIRAGSAHTFSQALDDSWQAARTACAAHGGITPEAGFVQAVEANAGAPQVVNAYEVRDRAGNPVGVVVAFSDGTAESCSGGSCNDYLTVQAAMAALGGAGIA